MASRLTPGILALIGIGDAALVTGALSAAGVLSLGVGPAVVLLALALVLNGLAVIRVVRAGRTQDR
jgi:hypothetical protein